MKPENINKFPQKNVWGMIGLSIITLTFYNLFWLKKTSLIINDLLPSKAFKSWGVLLIIIFIVMFNIGGILLTLRGDLAGQGDFELAGLILLVWNFKIRNRLNLILDAKHNPQLWLNAFWTLVFGIFYIQYKINKIRAM